jgi:hypothetical protein
MNQLTRTNTGHAAAPVAIDPSALSRLREKARLNAEVQVWRPNPGDVLEGVIAGSRMADGPFGPQRQAIIQTPAGALMAVWLTEWLLRQFKAQGAGLGDLVSLAFHGKETGRMGKTFNRMTCVVLKS